ncbi:hypothetical protein [Rhizobium sp. BK176]|uniref:hypothetical protein n=1 Tax=Rhizobium sp. BK176 TaxID=2587071 RepID=UPI002169F0D8|nr:hypothetical protein [Rhizobium sp. BK176]MCS4089913.1 hypothetical protein [Rhizobium sp. BK176]
MPRRYDFSNNPTTSIEDGYFHAYREARSGAGEVSYLSLWGPHGIFLFSGIHHQFDLKTPTGQSPYDNALVDPVFDWLSANAKGDWHWHEGQTNNYRSVSTGVYLADRSDIEAFKAKWGGIFQYDETRTVRNEAYREKNREAEAANVVPPYLSAERIKYMLAQMDQETGDYFDTISSRDGFDTMFAEAFDLVVAYILEEGKPSKHGPRMLDGTWHEGITNSVRAIGEWVRTGASDALRAEMAERDIADEGLADAFRAGLVTPPATAQNSPTP